MEIKIYTLPKCSYCLKLKGLLDDTKIKYKTVDISLDENEAEFDVLMKLSGSDSVPMVTVGQNLLAPDINFHSIDQAFELIQHIIKTETK